MIILKSPKEPAATNTMMKTLKIHRYRGFESFRLDDLAPVNLVVGKNSCGKTSILEAVELLVSRGHVSALLASATRREEIGDDDMNGGIGPNISHVFHGHRCEPGASFELSSPDGQQSLTATILSLDEVAEDDRWARRMKRQQRLDSDEEPEEAMFGLSLVRDAQQPIVIPVGENGTLLQRFWRDPMRDGASPKAEVRFLNFDLQSMRVAWNALLSDGREAEIEKAMRILIPEIRSIHFLAGDRRRGGILVGQRNGKPRLPIGSYGDGMRRLLAISLALVGTENGCLLIDEIDTGFHWTVMEDLWLLVVEAAQRLNVQVFATTHSYDCIQGLGALVRSRPDLAKQVAIQKVHQSLKQAVCIPGKEIQIAGEQGIEVR